MFKTIFKFELNYWFRNPSIYIYSALFFFIALGLMGGRAEAFDENTSFFKTPQFANSPGAILEMILFLMPLLLFMLPAIIGNAIYRDFKSHMYSLLFTYPFSKNTYLAAKLSSAFLVVSIMVIPIGLGLFIGSQLPTVNPQLIGPFSLSSYVRAYLIYLIPNLMVFGGIIFGLVLFTRNIYAGFITAIILILLQSIFNALFSGLDYQYFSALFDPFCQQTLAYITQYWKPEEFNSRPIPLKEVVIVNRVIWLFLGILAYFSTFRFFNFHYQPFTLKHNQQKPAPSKQTGNKLNIKLPKVSLNYSTFHYLKTSWISSNRELISILKSGLFLSILFAGILLIIFQQYQQPQQYGFKILPVTWQMLRIPAFLFGGIINMLTFLYAGMLIHKDRLTKMNSLVDSTPVPNWSILLSKFLALMKMQLILLGLIMVGGIAVQAYQGYYQFEISLYLFQLYAMNFWSHLVWAMVAVFVQTLLPNVYLAFFLLILGSMGIAGIPEFLGLKSTVFQFNGHPYFTYSDLDGYGNNLPSFFLYRGYWLLLGLALLSLSYLCWVRGFYFSLTERFSIIFSRAKTFSIVPFLLFVLGFLSLGFFIYSEEEINYEKINSAEEKEQWMVRNERNYKKYQNLIQPKIIDVKLELDLYPETRDFKSKGQYVLVNKSSNPIDTLLINYSYDEETTYQLSKPHKVISKDSFIRFDIIELINPLPVGDSIFFSFEVWNEPNSLFHSSSPIKGNGTFFTNEVFPGFGYRPIELTSKNKRKEYKLPQKENPFPSPHDTLALFKNYASKDADWIKFEATISTSADQIALAPGYLQKEWEKEGRRYFHYEMNSKIKHFFGFNSGRFSIRKSEWKGVDLEVYFHKDHNHNIDRMIEGLKGTLTYNSEHFSPYQHQQARIIEFPISIGSYATTFANSIPFSEIRFIGEVDDNSNKSIDLPFYVAAHELAHQWWGNQILPANVLGAKMLTESLAEYTALKVLEEKYGKAKLCRFLQLDLDLYLQGRAKENKQEMPLTLSYPHQDYIHYRKGALVFYALSDYLGEKRFNGAIKTYLEKVKFQEAPFTTSLELLSYIRKATPDSLQYLLEDMFETITLYDNKVSQVEVEQLQNGKYRIELDFLVSKFRDNGKGNLNYHNSEGAVLKFVHQNKKLTSLPLQDYIEIGVFQNQKTLHLKKYKVNSIMNKVYIIVDKKPTEVNIDPYYKLIDINSSDNLNRIN